MTFWNEGTFSLTSSMQEVHIIFKLNNLQSLDKVLLHLKKNLNFVYPKFHFLNKRISDQLAVGFSIHLL